MTEPNIRTEAVPCKQCGTELQITPAINFITCTFCGCPLKVRRTDDALKSEPIEKLQPSQDDSVNQATVVELAAQLEKLEAEWDKFQQSAAAKSNARPNESPRAKTLITIFLAILAIVATYFIATGSYAIGTCIGAIAVIVSYLLVLNSNAGNANRRDYSIAKTNYEKHKKILISTTARLQS